LAATPTSNCNILHPGIVVALSTIVQSAVVEALEITNGRSCCFYRWQKNFFMLKFLKVKLVYFGLRIL
jgi:hypothetical protein